MFKKYKMCALKCKNIPETCAFKKVTYTYICIFQFNRNIIMSMINLDCSIYIVSSQLPLTSLSLTALVLTNRDRLACVAVVLDSMRRRSESWTVSWIKDSADSLGVEVWRLMRGGGTGMLVVRHVPPSGLRSVGWGEVGVEESPRLPRDEDKDEEQDWFLILPYPEIRVQRSNTETRSYFSTVICFNNDCFLLLFSQRVHTWWTGCPGLGRVVSFQHAVEALGARGGGWDGAGAGAILAGVELG